MPRFRKRLSIVDAEQWFPGKHIDGVTELVHDPGDGSTKSSGRAVINAVNGPIIVRPGDWVVIDSKGIQSVYENDIFRDAYEPLPDLSEING